MEHGRTVLAATVRVGGGRIAAFTDSTVWSSFAVFSFDREKLAMDLVRLLNREESPYEAPTRCAAVAISLIALVACAWMVRSGMALPAILFGLAGLWGGAATSEALHRSIYAWPEPNAPISEVTFLWQGGACAYPPVLGSPDSRPAARCLNTRPVSGRRPALPPRVVCTSGANLLTPATRSMF